MFVCMTLRGKRCGPEWPLRQGFCSCEVKWSGRLYLERVAHLAKPVFHEALLKQHEPTNIHNIDYKGKQHMSEWISSIMENVLIGLFLAVCFQAWLGNRLVKPINW